MKTGRTLNGLEAELARQLGTKRDYLAPAQALHVSSNGHTDLTWTGGEQAYALTPQAHGQLAQYIGAPQGFYEFLRTRAETLRVPVFLPAPPAGQEEITGTGERQLRLAEDSPLFDVLVNRLLGGKEGDTRLVRTLDGNARAFLSDSFSTDLDNWDVYASAVQAMLACGLAPDDVASCEVTDTRLYVKVLSPKLTGDVAVGDAVQAGFVLTNSETGAGSLSIRQFVRRLVCDNGMVVEDAYRARHVGKRLEADADGAVYKSDTRQAEARLRLLTMRDHIQSAMDEHRFARTLTAMQEATTVRLEGKVEAVVEVTARRFGLHEGEREQVLRNLIEGGTLSLWGLANAVTLAASSADGYDRATDLEGVGGRLLALTAAEVKEIATAR